MFAGEHFLQRAELDIHAFLIGETRDGAEQRNVGIHGQPQFLLQPALFSALPMRSSSE